jgi:hypothetical protein
MSIFLRITSAQVKDNIPEICFIMDLSLDRLPIRCNAVTV